MTESNMNQQKRDIGGIVVSLLFIVVAVIAIWDTTSMLDSDSFVFPRAVAGSMIAFAILYIIRQFISPSIGNNDEEGSAGGSHVRRASLVVAMIISAMLMPWLGFLISGVLVFMSIMMLAMYDEWTSKRRVVFPLVGVIIVGGFYVMFAELLLVPLPVGVLFE